MEEEITKYIESKFTIDKEQLDRFGIKPEDYTFSLDKKDMLNFARHFAEWQKQKDFEDLLKSDMTQFKKCYEKGRFDMREEMMKDAVEGIVGGHTDIPAFINLEIEHKPNVKVGDKVKIVVLKTE